MYVILHIRVIEKVILCRIIKNQFHSKAENGLNYFTITFGLIQKNSKQTFNDSLGIDTS